MQIIPSTWTRYALAATGRIDRDPFNIFDAAATAARYLCIAGGDMGTSAGQLRAVFAYNHSNTYVSTVLTLENAYDSGFSVTGAGQVGAVVPRVTTQTAVTTASVPPANPGPPTAVAPILTDPGTPTPSATDSSSSERRPDGLVVVRAWFRYNDTVKHAVD